MGSFNGKYAGLDDNEAWLRVYDKGKNLMPIKSKEIQTKYNRMFKKKTKVIRGAKVKWVNTDSLVPDDVIFVEKGNFVPVDGIILEATNLYMENYIGMDFKDSQIDEEYGAGKNLYQGMRVKSGRAIIQAQDTGVETVLGKQVREIESFNRTPIKGFERWLFTFATISALLVLLGFFVSYFNSNSIYVALGVAAIMFCASFPCGFVILMGIRCIGYFCGLKKDEIILKNIRPFLSPEKLDVICIDRRFLNRNCTEYLSEFYNAGLRVIVTSPKDKESTLELMRGFGFDINDITCFSGDELDGMSDEDYIKSICEGILFYDINNVQKNKLVKTFESVKIKILSISSRIDELVSVWSSYFGVSSNFVDRSIDRALADVVLLKNDFTSIYHLVKSRGAFIREIKDMFLLNLSFQIPIFVLSVLAVIFNISLSYYMYHVFLLVFLVIPIILRINISNYEDTEISNKIASNMRNILKFVLAGMVVSAFLTIMYLGLSVIIKNQIINISIIAILQVVAILICSKLLAKKKLKANANEEIL